MKKGRVTVSIELSELYEEIESVDLLRRMLDYMFKGRYSVRINGKLLR